MSSSRKLFLFSVLSGLTVLILCAGAYITLIKPRHDIAVVDLKNQQQLLVSTMRMTVGYCPDPNKNPDVSNAVAERWVQVLPGAPGTGSFLMLWNKTQNVGTNLTGPKMTTDSDMNPQLSPDGKVVVFVREENKTSSIWIVNESGQSKQITSGPSGENATYPLWGPDGNIYYRSDRSVYQINPGGTGVKAIAVLEGLNFIDFIWQKAGLKLVATTTINQKVHYVIMNPDGTDQRDITDIC